MSSSSVRAPITMRLPFTPSSVSVARQRLKTWMDDNGGPGEAVEDARVVISELVANAVRHARPLADGQIQVTWTSSPDGLQLTVTDGGSGTRPRDLHASVLGAGRPRHGDRRRARAGAGGPSASGRARPCTPSSHV